MLLLYTQDRCPACVEAKLFLENKNIEFKEINISRNPKERLKLILDLDSQTTPTIVFNNTVIRGFNREEIINIIKP